MKTNIIKSCIAIILFSFAVYSTANARNGYPADSTNINKHSHMKMDSKMKMDSSMHMDTGMKGDKKENYSVPKEYKGTIDLTSIDVNKDGKVYQCPMDFNVLSDKPGKDPKCGMALKEVSLEQAKSNLTKHSFKVK